MPQVLLGLSLAISSFTSLNARPTPIGSQRELFVDVHLVESVYDLELRIHSPIKAPRPESPLPIRHAVTVIKDGPRYRAYYRAGDPSYKGPFYSGHPGETVRYAESIDGHNWNMPNLGLHEVGGTMANNVILANMSPYLHNFMPFLDARP